MRRQAGYHSYGVYDEYAGPSQLSELLCWLREADLFGARLSGVSSPELRLPLRECYWLRLLQNHWVLTRALRQQQGMC
jgi:hypothetical protein